MIFLSSERPRISVPSPLIGEAAPMVVPGAIRAMFPARVMNVPALAAKPPAGATQTMTGIVGLEDGPDDLVRGARCCRRACSA